MSDSSDFGKLSDGEKQALEEAKVKVKGAKKGKGKKRKVKSESELDDQEEPDSRKRRRGKRRELEDKFGGQFDYSSDEGKGQQLVKKGAKKKTGEDISDDEEARLEHLKGDWRKSEKGKNDDPEVFSPYRFQCEQRWNPLAKMMGVRLRIDNSMQRKKPKAIKGEPKAEDIPDELFSSSESSGNEHAHEWSEPPTEDEDEDADSQAKTASVAPTAANEDEDSDDLDAQIRLQQRAKSASEAKRPQSSTKPESPPMLHRAEPSAQRGTAESQGGDESMRTENDDWPRKPRKERPDFLMTKQQSEVGPLQVGDFAIPAPINRFLRPYQREGAEFLLSQYSKGIGGILGDDMGLGKTIQIIAFLSAVMKRTGRQSDDKDKRRRILRARDVKDMPKKASEIGPTCLIVCPASVLHNWEREIETWGYFSAEILEGDTARRKGVIKSFRDGYTDILLVGFEQARISIAVLSELDISICIVDEVHRMKNPVSKTVKAMREIGTMYRYGLTGTAIQNRLTEFWTILDWACPGHVGALWQWKYLVEHPITFSQSASATDEVLAKGRERALKLVGLVLPRFFLRRTKESVKLQLPQKTDLIVLCPLTTFQMDAYKRLLEIPEVRAIATAYDPCPCGYEDDDGFAYMRKACPGDSDPPVGGHLMPKDWPQLIFKYMLALQKAANHLVLLMPDNRYKLTDPERYARDVEWAQVALLMPPDKFKDGFVSNVKDEWCGKWKVLVGMLQTWHDKGEKVLVFSNSLRILDAIKDLLSFKSTFNAGVVYLDGTVSTDKRMEIVDRFNHSDDIFCFCVSTRAGGVGLNLTAASKVVIIDPSWNPSNDLQAMDRAYRFGQTKDVDVYRLIGAGTIEELIYHRQQYKRSIASVGYDAVAERRLYTGVIDAGPQNHGELFGVKNLFKLQEHHTLSHTIAERLDDIGAVLTDHAYDGDEDADADADGQSRKAVVHKGFYPSDELVDDDDETAETLQQWYKDVKKEEEEEASMTAEGTLAAAKAKERTEIEKLLTNSVGRFVSDQCLGETLAELKKTRAALEKQQKRGQQDRRAREPEAKAEPSTAFGARHKANQDLRAQVQVAKEKGKGSTANGQSHGGSGSDAAAAQAQRPVWDPLKRVSNKKKKASQPAQASSSHHLANANGGANSRDQRELILISSDDEVGAPSTSAAVAGERVRIKKESDATNTMLTTAAARDESPPLPPHPRIRIKPEPE